ncbi:MAG: DUF3604 domain-containing protein [Candidatus Thorarchaeota archaeon]|jgi:hypothetical protein
MSDDKQTTPKENETETKSTWNRLRASKKTRMLLKLSRVVLYMLGLWTVIFYFWSVIGLAIGTGVFLLSTQTAWRRHGIVLTFSVGIMTLAFNTYAWLWMLGIYLFLFVYLIGSLIHYIVKQVIRFARKYRGTTIKQPSLSRTPLRAQSRIKLLLTLAILLAPVFMWSSVNIDFGVMFDNAPVLLWVNAPSNANLGDDFEISVEAWDSFERLSGSYRGTVTFSLQSYNLTTGVPLTGVDASLPDEYTFTGASISAGIVPAYLMVGPEDFGLHSFSAQISTPGIHYILVEDSLTENSYWSNPVIVDDFPAGSPMIYWGDLHSHSMVSDGSGTPDESYYYGRYISKLDFMAMTDHGEDFTYLDRLKTGTAEFQDYLKSTSNAYEPGEFVSFYGAEWTSEYVDQILFLVPVPIASGGHYTCIFSGDSMPIFSAITENTIGELWTLLDDYASTSGDRALAIPHHTIRNQFIQDWTLMNPDYVRLVEVTSVHGECLFDNDLNYRGSVDLPPERVPGSSVIDAMTMGYRMSFIANGDNHDGHPGHSISHTRASIGHQYPFSFYNARNGHPYPSGITAVYATSLTRDGVFTGLETGRVYANSDHGRPILDFSINGVSVEYNATVSVASPTASRNLSIFIAQDGAPVGRMNQAATTGEDWIPEWGATVEIIKNGMLWQSIQISSPIGMITISDNSSITGTSYDDYILGSDGNHYINDQSENPIDPTTLNTDGMDYYAVRIVGANGRTSYIGPIWVHSP